MIGKSFSGIGSGHTQTSMSYKPNINDIQVSDWKLDIVGEWQAQIVIYLNGGKLNATVNDGGTYNFGYYVNVSVLYDATDKQKQTAIKKGVSKLLKEFDVAKTAKKHKYAGELNFLRSFELLGLHKYKEGL